MDGGTEYVNYVKNELQTFAMDPFLAEGIWMKVLCPRDHID